MFLAVPREKGLASGWRQIVYGSPSSVPRPLTDLQFLLNRGHSVNAFYSSQQI